MRGSLVVGESLVDVWTGADGSVVERPGGSPLNVAVGLARLGLPVTLLTAYGDDARGRLLHDHLTSSGVEVLRTPLERTSVAYAELDASGSATYRFELGWELAVPGLGAPPGWLHVGSLGASLEPGASVVTALVEELRDRAVVSFDPNCRPALMDRDRALGRIERLVAASDVVKLSDEDAGWLLPDRPAEELAERWLALGPALVVVTHGGAGAQGWTAAGTVRVGPAEGGPVVDTVGAGDAFTAGLLESLSAADVRGLPAAAVRAALERGCEVARRTCERAGADPPWRHEL